MRIGTIARAWIAVALTSGVVFASSSYDARQATADTVEGRSVFYRLLAKYQHGDEIVDFDIVVGCNVRVTRYGDGDRSFDALRDPVVFAAPTLDGGAIWQIVPNACQGATTENGEVPKDFLPGAVWFDSKDDFSLGVAYVTEDAFESGLSKLKFLGAAIHSATKQDWIAFQPSASRNLIDSRSLTDLTPWPSEEEVRANLWDKAKLNQWWLSSFECHGVERYEFSEESARALLRDHWPLSNPRFWMPPRKTLVEVMERLRPFNKAIVNGVPAREITSLAYARSAGFPTRARGGMLRSGKPWSYLPPIVFPMRADDGIPWASPKANSAAAIYRDIDLNAGKNQGFAYCYSFLFGRGVAGEVHIPQYRSKVFVTRIDGQSIEGESADGASPSARPSVFFERDRYLYRRFSFSLN